MEIRGVTAEEKQQKKTFSGGSSAVTNVRVVVCSPGCL